MTQTESTIVDFTQLAKDKVTQLLEHRGKGLGIKIAVKTTGCSGLAYVLEFVDHIPDHVISHQIDQWLVFIDKKAEPYVKGMTVDYVKRGLNEGFEFINPNESGRCGCGESFRV